MATGAFEILRLPGGCRFARDPQRGRRDGRGSERVRLHDGPPPGNGARRAAYGRAALDERAALCPAPESASGVRRPAAACPRRPRGVRRDPQSGNRGAPSVIAAADVIGSVERRCLGRGPGERALRSGRAAFVARLPARAASRQTHLLRRPAARARALKCVPGQSSAHYPPAPPQNMFAEASPERGPSPPRRARCTFAADPRTGAQARPRARAPGRDAPEELFDFEPKKEHFSTAELVDQARLCVPQHPRPSSWGVLF